MRYEGLTPRQFLGVLSGAFIAVALLVGALYGIGWGLYLLWSRVICESLLVCR